MTGKEKKAIELLQTLGAEMVPQPNNGNTDPVFWVVAENKREYGFADGYYDGVVAADCESEYETAVEFRKYLIECEDYPSKELPEDATIEELLAIAESSGFSLVGYSNKYDVPAPDTLFITKRECQNHIEQNHYHYKHPHTYAMTAWRSPQIEQLYKVLKETDWARIAQALTLLEKQEQGLIVKLPCRTGDTVWIEVDGKVVEAYLQSIYQNHTAKDKSRWVIAISSKEEFVPFGDEISFARVITDNQSLGKDWWLTKEEAEAEAEVIE